MTEGYADLSPGNLRTAVARFDEPRFGQVGEELGASVACTADVSP